MSIQVYHGIASSYPIWTWFCFRFCFFFRYISLVISYNNPFRRSFQIFCVLGCLFLHLLLLLFLFRLLCSHKIFVQLADYRTSYYYCSSQPLGIENKAIRDSAFNFSHSPQGYPGHSPSVRLASDGGWCPLASKDSFVFVRVSFQAVHIICAIGLQGNAKNTGFVSKYKLKLAIEDSGEEFYRERGEIKVSALIERKTFHSIRKRSKEGLKDIEFLRAHISAAHSAERGTTVHFGERMTYNSVRGFSSSPVWARLFLLLLYDKTA